MFLASIMSAMRVCVSLSSQANVARASSPTAMLPGVFFVYDFSAFMVEVTRYRNTVAHLLVRVCAVLGGVSTVVAFLDWLAREAQRRGVFAGVDAGS